MVAGLLLVTLYCFGCWLVFFRFRWLRFTPGWGVISALVGIHLLLIFLIGLRFVTPSSDTAQVVQYTVQLVPRLPEPTLLTEVLVAEGTHVKKGQPLFRFDRTVYEAKVRQLEAQLAKAQQNVKVLQADVTVAEGKQARLKSQLAYDQQEKHANDVLAAQGFSTQMQADLWNTQVRSTEDAIDEATAELARATLNFEANIDGVNTTVATLQAELQQARYYLENTTIVAPENGRIVNLQVRPGMVSGILRVGGIAAFIEDSHPYVLATYYQPQLKYVTTGMPAEVALDAYPGQIFKGTVEAIWKTNAQGQYLPSDVLPTFNAEDPHARRGEFAVKIALFAGTVADRVTIGTHGVAAIYTNGFGGGWAALRRIAIRGYSWFNWLYPLSL
jgi:multidrug resistance efflux pump